LPRPFGELDHAPADHIAEHAYAYGDRPQPTRKVRRGSTRDVLGYLGQFNGNGWQQKWDSNPLGTGTIRAADIGPAIMVGIRALYCLRVVRPTLLVFRTNPPNSYSTDFVAAPRDALLDRFVSMRPSTTSRTSTATRRYWTSPSC
jgi:hypothetical protein